MLRTKNPFFGEYNIQYSKEQGIEESQEDLKEEKEVYDNFNVRIDCGGYFFKKYML